MRVPVFSQLYSESTNLGYVLRLEDTPQFEYYVIAYSDIFLRTWFPTDVIRERILSLGEFNLPIFLAKGILIR